MRSVMESLSPKGSAPEDEQDRCPGGTIRLSGRGTTVVNESLRVVGGTGTYAGARGVVEVRALDLRSGRALNVYRLQLP